MKTSLRTLVLAIGCVGSASAWANAGLTSAGVNQPQTNNADEPTLAQVAPIQNGVAGGQANAGGAVPGTAPSAAARAGIVNPNQSSGTQSGEARAAEQARPPAPPPPPDPSKLPVSVIRPLNRSAAPAPPAGEAPPVSSTIRPHADESHPEAKKAPIPSMPQHATASPPPRPLVHARPATTAVAPVSHDAKAAKPASSDGTGDASSSGFIFYTGLGVAAAILLLSFGAFFRSSTDEHPGTGPR